jgi:uncharacterized protein YgfB (UPF0149 family)
MSDLYKEWQDVMHEYTKEQRAFAEAHERYHKIYAHIKQQRTPTEYTKQEKKDDK